MGGLCAVSMRVRGATVKRGPPPMSKMTKALLIRLEKELNILIEPRDRQWAEEAVRFKKAHWSILQNNLLILGKKD
jgi:hypothetical protein